MSLDVLSGHTRQVPTAEAAGDQPLRKEMGEEEKEFGQCHQESIILRRQEGIPDGAGNITNVIARCPP